MQCALETSDTPITFLRARDGSRTAKIAGRWLGGCSVPRRAAEQMLRKLIIRGNVACLLLPTHAQQVAVALERIPPNAALIVLAIDAVFVDLAKQCLDFTPFLNAGKLFFAHDDASLRSIFTENPGLPIPQQFIRLPVTRADLVDERIKPAQAIFSEVVQRQGAARAALAWKPEADHLCVLASNRFQLWNDAGAALSGCLEADFIDLDDPRCTAPVYIATRAARCAALITADHARADQPDLLPADQPWLAWLMTPRVPAFLRTSPNDALLLADESLRAAARQAGWPDDRVAVAAAPPIAPVEPIARTLALLADLPDLTPPAEIEEFSSWRVVWDAIRKELIDNPHRVAGDIDGYLEKARRHFGIPAENFPQQTFIDRLIAPAYTIGIARWLAKQSVPVTIHGAGWTEIDGVTAQGAVADRDRFRRIVGSCAGLVDSAIAITHPVRSLGRPILTTFGRTPQRILQDANAILAGRVSAAPALPRLDAQVIRRLLAR